MARLGVYCHLKRTIRNKKGLIEFEDIARAHSFTKNFGYLILHGFDGVANTDYKDIGNVSRRAAYNYTSGTGNSAGINAFASAGAVNRGIVVGTSNTPFSIDQYIMGALVANGTGSGQLSYAIQNYAVPVLSGSDILLTLSRDIANNSGGTITLNEVGLYGYPIYNGSDQTTVLFLRDVIDATPLETGKVLNLQYTLKTTVV